MQKFLSENFYPANGVDDHGITRASGGVLSFVFNFASFTNSQI